MSPATPSAKPARLQTTRRGLLGLTASAPVLALGAQASAAPTTTLAAVATGEAPSSREGIYPAPGWEPFTENSNMWTTPVRRRPTLHPNSSAMIANLLALSPVPDQLTVAQPSEYDWGKPVYYADANDPLVTIRRATGWESYECDSVDGKQFRIPAGAKAPRPYGDPDSHMCVINVGEGTVIDMWKAGWVGGELHVGGGGVFPLTGSGNNRPYRWGANTDAEALSWYQPAGTNFNYGGATAAGFSTATGYIQAEHLVAGRIPHALFGTVRNCGPGYVYPASFWGVRVWDSNRVKMGMRLWLDMSISQINALPVHPWQRIILRAMHEFGIWMGDTGASSWKPAHGLSGLGYTAYGRTDPLRTYAESNPGFRQSTIGWLGSWWNVPQHVWQQLRVLEVPAANGDGMI
ncbi:hypothetical protein ACQP1U_12020 [Actinomycetota bacterium]